MDAQMYKIYINGTPLQLIAQDSGLPEGSETHLIARYPGISKMLLNYVDMLEKKPKFKVVTLYAAEVEQLYHDFVSHFTLEAAAGGLVFRPDGHILVMHRRGFWDLPKGKLDPGETPEEAAVREVTEETGVNDIVRHEQHITTYHTYRKKNGKRVLKRTVWYRMEAPDQSLTPQTEEDIDAVHWMAPRTFLLECSPMYGNIRDVVFWGLNGDAMS